jgi:hypothetical protein
VFVVLAIKNQAWSSTLQAVFVDLSIAQKALFRKLEKDLPQSL